MINPSIILHAIRILILCHYFLQHSLIFCGLPSTASIPANPSPFCFIRMGLNRIQKIDEVKIINI